MKGSSRRAFAVSFCAFLSFLCGCGKNPLAPPGYVSFGVEVGSPRGPTNAISQPAVLSPNVRVLLPSVTIDRIDVSETGADWQTILNVPATMSVTGENVAVTISSVRPLRPGEYHGVRAWFGKRLVATIEPILASDVTRSGTDTLEDFDRSNPRTFTTRDGGMAFPFIAVPGQDQFVVFSFDFSQSISFSDSWVFIPPSTWSNSYSLVHDPASYPKVIVRVSRFKG